MNKQTSSQSGQAIVMVAISLVVLLGFAALAVDGSMIYSDRRHAQNAADAASLAGAGTAALYLENGHLDYTNWNCSQWYATDPDTGENWDWRTEQKAIDRAGDNNFAIDRDVDDNHGVKVICNDYPLGGWDERSIDVNVYISSTTQTYFAHLIFGREVVNQVMATTRIYPRTPLAYAHAVVSTSELCNNVNDKMVFDGGINLDVYGGGVFSNSCIEGGGASGEVTVHDGFGLTCVGDDCADINNTVVEPADITETPRPLPRSMFDVPVPKCELFHPVNDDHGSFSADGKKNGEETIEPGYYDNIKILNNEDNVVMEPGLYCLTGEFQMSNGMLYGSGVTFFLESGTFSTSGGEVTVASPPGTDCGSACDDYHALPGVLVYLSPNNTNSVSLLGNSDSYYEGLIYVPAGTIEVGGTGDVVAFNTQFVSNNVQLHGGAQIEIHFDDKNVWMNAAQIELYK